MHSANLITSVNPFDGLIRAYDNGCINERDSNENYTMKCLNKARGARCAKQLNFSERDIARFERLNSFGYIILRAGYTCNETSPSSYEQFQQYNTLIVPDGALKPTRNK